MERAALERMEQELDGEVRERFPGAPIQRVQVLQYGDDPEVEPGELLARIVLDAPGGKEERRQVLDDFEHTHREAIHQLRRDLDKAPEAGLLEFVVGGEADDGEHRGPGIRLARPRGALGGGGDGPLVPVMARLGPADLETVDALITAGIAANRAEAVRWALARIRERPAYEKLRERAREIEDLKSQF
ncbi:MAG TPA: hypothetical protein VGN41_04550 [Streptosporangiaceae bacterium]|jgi:hypothetical protein